MPPRPLELIGHEAIGVFIDDRQAIQTRRLPTGQALPAGKPTKISFKITIPSGATLTHYRTGAGPHASVDLVIVRQGADAIIYTDTTLAKNGVAREGVNLPAPGRYRVIVESRPKHTILFRAHARAYAREARAGGEGLLARGSCAAVAGG